MDRTIEYNVLIHRLRFQFEIDIRKVIENSALDKDWILEGLEEIVHELREEEDSEREEN